MADYESTTGDRVLAIPHNGNLTNGLMFDDVTFTTRKPLSTDGSKSLSANWTDPDFDPAQRPYYYVRVLEIPTPRWTTYDSVLFNRDIPEGAPVSIQERAYTSPIWYTRSR